MLEKLIQLLGKFFSKNQKKRNGFPRTQLTKRQKFAAGVLALSVVLFASEYVFEGYTILIAIALGILTDLVLYGAIFEDLKENFSWYPFILPFLCSLSFALFYFLAPSRLLTRLILTTLYAIGLYSLFLSENIFSIASIRTIQLLNSARIVAFVITLVSYFFLTNIIFSLRLGILPAMALYLIFSLLYLFHSLWTYTLEISWKANIGWVIILGLCFLEIASIVWFWPVSPTIFALFMTSIFYILTGLVNVWLERRLFKNVMWEYIWVSVIAFVLIVWLTPWQ